jgi:hypothetical protein
MLPTVLAPDTLFTTARRLTSRSAVPATTPTAEPACSPQAARLLRQQARLSQLFWLLTAGVASVLLLSGLLG